MSFPAGEVSHYSIATREISDPPWHKTIGRLVHLTGASVLPVYFYGRNSSLFHIAGLVHPRLRTALLPRELLRKRSVSIQYRIGHQIPYRRLSYLHDYNTLTSYLRFRTELPGKFDNRKSKILSFPMFKRTKKTKTITFSEDRDVLLKEKTSLPINQRLLRNGDFSVFWARCAQIPHILHEIGRLRELTFRSPEKSFPFYFNHNLTIP